MRLPKSNRIIRRQLSGVNQLALIFPSGCTAKNESGGSCSCSDSSCTGNKTCNCQDASGANSPSCSCS